MSRFRASSSASPAVAIALAAIAFGAAGGTQVGRAAPTEAIVILAAGLLLAAAIPSFDLKRPLYGGTAIALLTALAILTGLSMNWSVAPDLSIQELGRTFTYLAVFTVAVVAARRVPRGGSALLNGILMATAAVCLWALATRVWPASLGGDVLGARLGEPFDYWNALGGMAALAVPARPVGRRPPRRAALGRCAGLPRPDGAAADDHADPVARRPGRRHRGRRDLAGGRAAAPAHRTRPGGGRRRRGSGDRLGALAGGLHRRAAAAVGARGRRRAPSAC